MPFRLIAGNYGVAVELDTILEHLHACADAVQVAYAADQGRGYSGQRATQYHLDLAADAAAVEVLTRAGFRVVSEESGITGEGALTVVLDPIDGSTNCDRSIPFFATSIAVLDGDGHVDMTACTRLRDAALQHGLVVAFLRTIDLAADRARAARRRL